MCVYVRMQQAVGTLHDRRNEAGTYQLEQPISSGRRPSGLGWLRINGRVCQKWPPKVANENERFSWRARITQVRLVKME